MSDLVTMRLPATSANLGPAFDAVAVALNLHLEIEARPAGVFAVSAEGRDRELCGNLRRHLILETYTEILSANRKEVVPLSLHIRNQIPLGKGLGSSAAARLAAIALANHFGKLGWQESRILDEAAVREGHPDNVAACWLGGLVAAAMPSCRETEESAVQAVRFSTPVKWPILAVLPPNPLSTEAARNVLPEVYPRSDVVSNLQRSLLLVGAWEQGNAGMMGAALRDRLHEPYREKLCPLLPAMRELAGQDGILGVVLSGAGPAVLMILETGSDEELVLMRVKHTAMEQGSEVEAIVTEVEERGARESAEMVSG
ncbi:MAG TPA: homoserine kinase [Terriglobales bacterium]|nr:homoserine kinase [Terriglobales bacterium]